MIASDFFRLWLEEQQLLCQRSTWEALTVYIGVHIEPYFAGMDLEEITPFECQRFAKDKLSCGRADGRGGLSPVSVRKHVSILKRSLGDAVVRGLIPSNPAQYVRLPRCSSSENERTVFLTAEEGSRLLEAFEGLEIYPIVALALYYGLRRSEVLGLRWQDVNFYTNTITIRHTVVKNLTTEAKDSTKTMSSRRTFQLLPEIRDILLTLRSKPFRSDYIFARADGSPMRPDSLTRSFQRVLEHYGFPKMRFHDLRHSTASILFDRGWSLEDVKNWLGHTDIETTSNIYLHYSRSRKVLLANDLEGMLIKKQKT